VGRVEQDLDSSSIRWAVSSLYSRWTSPAGVMTRSSRMTWAMTR
jgi:hypothetical protein